MIKDEVKKLRVDSPESLQFLNVNAPYQVP